MNDRELEETIDRYLRDDLDDSEKESLTKWLDAEERNQDRFIASIELNHALICALKGAEAEEENVGQIAPKRWPRRSWMAGVAAALLIGIFLNVLWRDSPRQGTKTSRVDASIQESPTAVVTQAIDVTWVASDSEIAPGMPVENQWVRISSGVLQLEFLSGALVALKGPAALRIDSGTECYLMRGTLVARAPIDAATFTVRSPGSEIVDLGTEFAVVVDADGRTDVHVLDGEVEVSPANGTGQNTRLVENEAASVGPREQEIKLIAFQSAPFAPLRAEAIWRSQPLRLQFDCGMGAGLYSGVESPAHRTRDLNKRETFWNPVIGDHQGQFVTAHGDLVPYPLEIDYGRSHEETSTVIDWSLEPDERRNRSVQSHGIYDTALGKDDINAEGLVGVRVRGLPVGLYRIYFIGRETSIHPKRGNYLEQKAHICEIGINLDRLSESPLQISPLRRPKAKRWVAGQTHLVSEVTVRHPDDYITMMTAKDRKNSPVPAGGRSSISGFQIIQIQSSLPSPTIPAEAQ